MMSDLLDCPFCGNAAGRWQHEIEGSGDSCTVFHIGCVNVSCAVKPAVHVPGQWGYKRDDDLTDEQAREKAIAGWNRRSDKEE
jgi:hypothetical protein